jgi:small subunit ribosomal protein S7
MSRKILKSKRKKSSVFISDYKYGLPVVFRLINKLNFKGKKSISESIVYDSFDIIEREVGENPVSVFNKALENIRPLLEVKSRRVGGTTYQIPVEVSLVRSTTIAINWLIEVARNKVGKSMSKKLAQEIIDGSKKEGTVIKKREDMHKMAEANKAFAHYRW